MYFSTVNPFDECFYIHPYFTRIIDLKEMICQRHAMSHQGYQVLQKRMTRKRKTNNMKNNTNNSNNVDETKWETLHNDNRKLAHYHVFENCVLRYYCSLAWKKERIIWIAHLKNNFDFGDKINKNECYLANMPKDIVLYIISFFKYSKSKVDDSIWVRKNINHAWKECIVLYDAFNALKVHYLNYSSFYDEWIDKSDVNNISMVDPNVVIKDFKDI